VNHFFLAYFYNIASVIIRIIIGNYREEQDMTTIFKAAFIFIAPETKVDTNSSWVLTPEVHVKTLAVSSYQEACDSIDGLEKEGIRAIELCGGFGQQGVAEIAKAVAGRMPIGVVRFDHHPCLGNVSGDALFLPK
jgi:hypothetical protein